MKAYTSLEQSKKLAEILPIESADMTYCAITEGMREKTIIKDWQVNIGLDTAIRENLFSYRNGYMVPCWSLTALLQLIPKEQHPTLVLNAHYRWICDINNPGSFTYEPTSGDNPLDAVFEMIIKLHELKLL